MDDCLYWVALCVSCVCIIVNVMQYKWYEGMLFLVIALLQVCNIQKGMGK
jgi:hypothetical protein